MAAFDPAEFTMTLKYWRHLRDWRCALVIRASF
jgi:hypothetical protein